MLICEVQHMEKMSSSVSSPYRFFLVWNLGAIPISVVLSGFATRFKVILAKLYYQSLLTSPQISIMGCTRECGLLLL